MALELSAMEHSEEDYADNKNVGEKVISPPRLQYQADIEVPHEEDIVTVSDEPPVLDRVSEEEEQDEKENVGALNTNVAVVTGML